MLIVPQSALASTQPTRTLYGSVLSSSTGQPILGVTVSAASCSYARTAMTGAEGFWQLTFPYGSYGKLTFSAVGYADRSFEITLNADWIYSGGVISLQPVSGTH